MRPELQNEPQHAQGFLMTSFREIEANRRLLPRAPYFCETFARDLEPLAASKTVVPCHWKTYRLLGADGHFYTSFSKGQFGGNTRGKIFGQLNCSSALRAVEREKTYEQYGVILYGRDDGHCRWISTVRDLYEAGLEQMGNRHANKIAGCCALFFFTCSNGSPQSRS
jgi:hypothetical protein